MKPAYRLSILIVASGFFAGCGPSATDQLNASAAVSGVSTNESLYVASGSCYGGGVATSTPSATVAAFDPATGLLRRVVVDYNQYSPGDMPVAIAEYDATRLLITVENAAGRRVDLVKKDGSSVTTYLSNSVALNGVLHATKLLPDGSLLISKSTAIEKFTPAKARVLQGASAFIQAPGSVCATAATLITAIETLPNGKVIFAHSAASPNNKLDLVVAAGYAAAPDCLATQAAPDTFGMPTAIIVHSTGNVLVAYGSTTAASNYVYAYPINQTTNVIGTPIASFKDSGVVLNGSSALAEDPNTTDVFVANALSSLNTIERFSYVPATGILTNIPSKRIGPNVYTRCVAAMKAIKE
jgi:hypothetical protein